MKSKYDFNYITYERGVVCIAFHCFSYLWLFNNLIPSEKPPVAWGKYMKYKMLVLSSPNQKILFTERRNGTSYYT